MDQNKWLLFHVVQIISVAARGETYNLLFQVISCVLQCAKLAPHWYTAYRQLGHLYSQAPATLDKARRCYQRALVLNPADISTQMALSDTYWALGDHVSRCNIYKTLFLMRKILFFLSCLASSVFFRLRC